MERDRDFRDTEGEREERDREIQRGREEKRKVYREREIQRGRGHHHVPHNDVSKAKDRPPR